MTTEDFNLPFCHLSPLLRTEWRCCLVCAAVYTFYLLSLLVTIACIRELETRACHSVCPSNCQLSSHSSTVEPFSLLPQTFLVQHRFCARLQHIVTRGKWQIRITWIYREERPQIFLFHVLHWKLIRPVKSAASHRECDHNLRRKNETGMICFHLYSKRNS
jgi:hypothetical protein